MNQIPQAGKLDDCGGVIASTMPSGALADRLLRVAMPMFSHKFTHGRLMISLTKIICRGLGTAVTYSLPIAMASGLPLVITALYQPPTLAQATPQPLPQKGAAALGGALTPSNSALFQAPQEKRTQQAAPKTLKVDSTNQIRENVQTPLEWQSEHLDNQRRNSGGFSFVNVDLD